MRAAAPALTSRCGVLKGCCELRAETLWFQYSLSVSCSCPRCHEDREQLLRCKPILAYKELGRSCLRLPCETFGALKLAVAAQIDMHVFSPSRSFDEGADHVQWKSWAASGQQ